jgi:hypothetical protein
MKTESMIRTLVLSAMLAWSGVMLAGDPEPRVTASKAQHTIREYFRFPSFINQLPSAEEKVEVLFTTATDGKINFVFAKTENTRLKKAVESKLTGLKLDDLQANVVHTVVLTFRKQ